MSEDVIPSDHKSFSSSSDQEVVSPNESLKGDSEAAVCQIVEHLVPNLINVDHISRDDDDLNAEARESLFKQAQELENSNDKTGALSLYLQCLDGLTVTTIFSSFPTCLRNVANIYYEQEDYSKAINFIQAEKLFYEASLIDNCTLQKKLEDSVLSKLTCSSDRQHVIKSDSADVIKANEYESLALFCRDKKHFQLALEYASKSCQLRRDVFGGEHALTAASAKLVTELCKEAEQDEYSDSLSDYLKRAPHGTPTGKHQTASILKNTLNSPSSFASQSSNPVQTQSSEVKKRVRFAPTTQVTPIESVGNGLPVNRRGLSPGAISLPAGRSTLSGGDATLSYLCQLMILMASMFLAASLGVLMLMLTCRYVKDPTCRTLDQWIHRIDNWTRFYYFKWTSSSSEIVG